MGAGSDAEAETTMVYCMGAVLFERLHHLGDGGAFLADGDVDADDVAALLIDDGVDGDGGFAGLTVADDELALAAGRSGSWRQRP